MVSIASSVSWTGFSILLVLCLIDISQCYGISSIRTKPSAQFTLDVHSRDMTSMRKPCHSRSVSRLMAKDIEDEDKENVDLSNLSIEELVALAQNQRSSVSNEKIAENINQKKKREDREYEAYWKKRNESPPTGSRAAQLKERAIRKAYYSLKDESSYQAAEAMSNFGNVESDLEAGKQILKNGRFNGNIVYVIGELYL